MGLGFIVMLYAVQYAMVEAPVGVQWLLLTYLLHTFGELALSPVGLSAFSRYSPKKYLRANDGPVVFGIFSWRSTCWIVWWRGNRVWFE